VGRGGWEVGGVYPLGPGPLAPLAPGPLAPGPIWPLVPWALWPHWVHARVFGTKRTWSHLFVTRCLTPYSPSIWGVGVWGWASGPVGAGGWLGRWGWQAGMLSGWLAGLVVISVCQK
jgi:hypothetical protein